MARQGQKQEEFLEAAFDFGQWIERHWKTVLRYAAVLLVVALVIAAVFGWRQAQINKATAKLAIGTAAFDRAADSQFVDFEALAEALTHFEEAEKKSGSGDPGRLASYYRGVTLYRLGRNDEAIAVLQSLVDRSKGGTPLDWAGLALLARLEIEGGDASAAVGRLQTAREGEATYPRDQLLLLLGDAQQAAGDTAAARSAWQLVVDEFEGTLSQTQARDRLGDGS